ncbi:MAG: ABC transporter permease, partial [Oscillospiraceae bacterium]
LNISYIPVINPDIITGISFMILFVSLSQYSSVFKLGFYTILIAHITFNTPYVILSVLPKLRQLDKHQYEAALDLGCTDRQAFYKVVLPQIMPGIVTGFLMSIAFSIDDFVISYFTSGPSAQTLPVTINSMIRRVVTPEIYALSTIMFLVILTLLLIYNVIDNKKYKKRG